MSIVISRWFRRPTRLGTNGHRYCHSEPPRIYIRLYLVSLTGSVTSWPSLVTHLLRKVQIRFGSNKLCRNMIQRVLLL